MNYTYIQTKHELTDFFNTLKKNKTIELAIDIEAEFNLHSYGEKLCLVQIYDGSEAVLIDGLHLDADDVKLIFASPGFIRLVYGVASDRVLIFRKYSIELSDFIDLQCAAEALEFDKKGLDAILERELGIVPTNKKKFQRYNWQRRPISPEAMEYAVGDVIHLFALRDSLIPQLKTNQVYDDFLQLNKELANRELSMDHIPGLFKKMEYRKLKAPQKQCFKACFDIREGYAQTLDLPPNSVFTNTQLFQLARNSLKPDNLWFEKRVPQLLRDKIKKELQEFCS